MSAAPRGVSRTALLMAALRIEEGERADPLVHDPLAQEFIAAAGGGDTPTTAVLPAGASAFLALRTRFFDDAVLAACATGVRQVVLLRAGLDARAFRLDWPPGVRLLAGDRPAMQATSTAIRQTAGAQLSTMDDPAAWLAGYGWRARTAHMPEVAAGYGRPLPEDRDEVAAQAMILTTATRSAHQRR